jgi:ADP-heptose:LPS heptosyltransferase
MMGARPTLLALRALGLGDLLTAVPALRALARAFPGHRRVLAAPRALEPIVELIDAGASPGGHGRSALDSRAVHGVADTRELAPISSCLHRADLAVNLHGRGPQSHDVLRRTSPRRLVAFSNSDVGAEAELPTWDEDEHEAERWCRLLRQSGIAADPLDLDLPAPKVRLPKRATNATLVHPGAASPARRWPPERWAAVARAERDSGREVIVTGAARERDLALQIAREAALSPSAVLAGHTDLRELAALTAAAGRVLCGDTGIGHLATALGTPSVVLFGPSTPTEWGPLIDLDRHVVLWSGRRGDPNAKRPDPGLLEIGVNEVLEALSALPDGGTPSRRRLCAAA